MGITFRNTDFSFGISCGFSILARSAENLIDLSVEKFIK